MLNYISAYKYGVSTKLLKKNFTTTNYKNL